MYLICFDTCLVGVWYLLICEVENGEVSVVTIGIKNIIDPEWKSIFLYLWRSKIFFCRFFACVILLEMY